MSGFKLPPSCGPVMVLYPYPETLEEGILNNLQHLNPIPEHEGFEYRPMIDPVSGEIRQMYPQDIERIKKAFGYTKDQITGKWLKSHQ